ncbi:apolipoprotein C-I [Salarias fasciatus]|uniref:Apolipoprotein C-I-like n=1 Tax=Salarias fasciatus TaxID=181472 RepID=A0A672FCP2_SALFA|nr:apolipoprotein C-I-like [Salarias fasciatus]
MRLFLAVAVLMLALVAYTEAQDDTLEAKLNKIKDQFTEMGSNLADHLSTTFRNVQDSDTIESIKSWWAQQLERLKQ